MRILLHAALLLSLSAPLCLAKKKEEKKDKTQTDEIAFKALDLNGDSMLSLQEFAAPTETPEKAAEFSKLDVNKDGSLTLEEFSARTVRGKPERKKRKKKNKDAEVDVEKDKATA